MEAGIVAVISGVASAIAVIITSLRKRRDVDVDEMKIRIKKLTGRIERAEAKIAELRSKLVNYEGVIFRLRSVLARNGIQDPTKAQGGPDASDDT